MRKKRLASYADGSHEDSQVNLTPLIDVVFVVLILFIIIAPMLELDRIELATGASKENREMASVQEDQSLTIHVHEDNSIWYNKKLVSAEQLLPLLKRAHTQFPTKIPQIFHDKKATFGTYQTVKNAVELSGYEQMDVILQPGG